MPVSRLYDYIQTVLGDGPVGFWPLNEGSGPTAADDSGGGFAGTYTGGFTLAQPGPLSPSQQSSSVLLNGSAGYVSVPYAAQLNPNVWTWEIWIRPLATGIQQFLFATENGTSPTINGAILFIFSDDSLNFKFADGTGDAGVGTPFPGGLKAGNWYHVASTWDSVNHSYQLWINGASQASGSFTPPSPFIQNTTQQLSVGGDVGTVGFNGDIAYPAVYNYALTSAQVAAHYAAAVNQPASSLFLPRRMGPRAVGRTFAAGLVPAIPAIPLSLTAAISDTSLSADSLAPAFGTPRATADTSLSADALARSALAPARTIADASLSSDSLTRALASPRSVSDTSLSSDSLARALNEHRTTSDASLSTDSLARSALAFSRTASDTTLSADVLTRVVTVRRSAAEASASTDTTARSPLAFSRAIGDASASSDSTSTAGSGSRATSDSTTTADALTRALRQARTLADSSTSADSLTTSTTGPAPPPITPTTNATLLQRSSAATLAAPGPAAHLLAYISGAHLAYSSRALLSSTTTRATILTYSSTAAIRSYEGLARIGPRLG